MSRVAALLTATLLVTAATAQAPSRVRSTAEMPPREALDRVNLKLAWSSHLPLDTRLDAVAKIQLIDDRLLVQQNSGLLSIFDANNGVLLVRVQPPMKYPPAIFDVAADDRFFMLVNGTRLYAFNRQVGPSMGRLEWMYEFPTIPSSSPVADLYRLYICLSGNRLTTFDLPEREVVVKKEETDFLAETKLPTMREIAKKAESERASRPAKAIATPDLAYRPVSGPPTKTAAPSILMLESVNPPYRLNSNTRQTAASIPVMSSVNPPYQLNSNTQTTPSIVVVSELYRVAELSNRSKPASPLSLRWTYVAGFRMNQPPLITSERLLAISTEREIVATPKLMNQELMSFRTDSPISATASKLGDVAYLPTSDASLYALHAISGRILWRFGADGSLTQKPAVTFNDVFVVSTLGNLYRVDRDQGLSVWRDGLGRDLPIQGISSFVSTNDRFVYAMDKRENLIVADRDRGQILGQIDLSGFTVAMRNDQTDRIYLASQDGKIICMHDLALSAPIPLKKKDIESEPAPAVVPAKPKPMPKFPEGQPVEPKKKDDKKNEKKDE